VAVGIDGVGSGTAAFGYVSRQLDGDPAFTGFRLYGVGTGTPNPVLDEYEIDLPLSSSDPYFLRLVVHDAIAYGYYRADSADEWILVCQSAVSALAASYRCGIFMSGGINGIGVVANGVELDNLNVYAYQAFADTFPLSEILDDVMPRVGLDASEYDNSDATAELIGYMIPSRMPAKNAIDTPLAVFGVDLAEVDGEIRAITTGNASSVTIPEADLGAITEGNDSKETISVQREPDLDIPSRIDFGYVIQGKNFQQGVQSAVRHTKGHVQESQTVNSAITMTDDQARPRAEEMLYRAWLQREAPSFSLGPKYFRYAPGDVATLPIAGENVRCKLVRCDIGLLGEMRVTAVTDDDDVSDQPASGGDSGTDDTTVGGPGDTTLIAWNGNALIDDHADSVGIYMAGMGPEGWLGADVYMSRDGGTTYQFFESLPVPAIIGESFDTLASFDTTGLVDESTLTVIIDQDLTLESVSHMEMLNGSNPFRLGTEVMQFRDAVSLGGGIWELTGLLRGRRGTEIESHIAGESFLMLYPDEVVYKEVGEDLINKTVKLKGVSIGKTLADATAQDVEILGLEYKCYSGCSIEGARDGSNNLTIDWKRRTRLQGYLRDYEDVPLGEETESYEVDIWDGASVVRTITGLSSPTASYSAANQTTDGLTPGDPVTVRIYQIGKYSLRGYVAEATI
jgi:hypothetical protein